MSKYVLLAFSLASTFFFTEGMEDRKRKREKQPEAPKHEPASKKSKTLTSEEQKNQDGLLISAISNNNPSGVRQALENGANPNPKYFETPLYIAINRTNNPYIISLLLQHGAVVGMSEMAALATRGQANDLLNFAQYGAPFYDQRTQGMMLGNAISRAQELSNIQMVTIFSENLDKEKTRALDVLLWLLLRIPVNKKSISSFKGIFEKQPADRFTTIIRERLGPILIDLLFNDGQTAIESIKAHMGNDNLTEDTQRMLNEALIFVAANGKMDILELLLNHFESILAKDYLIEALRAAALRGQLNAFQILIDSNLVTDELPQALESILLIAAAQHHEDIFRYILELNFHRFLNLNTFPVLERLNLLISENTPEVTIYKRLRHILILYRRAQNAERMLKFNFREVEQEDDEEKEKEQEIEQSTFPIPSLPPELVHLIASFLRP